MEQISRPQISGENFQKASGHSSPCQTHTGIFHLQPRAFFRYKSSKKPALFNPENAIEINWQQSFNTINFQNIFKIHEDVMNISDDIQ